jgi:plastocyanin
MQKKSSKIIFVFQFLFLISCHYLTAIQAIELKEGATVKVTTIKGKITLTGKQSDKAKLEDVFVYYQQEKNSFMPKSTPFPEPLNIKMKNKAYVPRVSVVPAGTEIKIENADSILHNAFSPSRPNQFDLGLYKKNAGKIQVLSHPGVVKLFCNVHYHMVAYVLVLDTPYFTRVQKDGSFEINGIQLKKDVNLNKGKLYLWHERAKRTVRKIILPLSDELELNLSITKRRIPEHNNKSGKRYKKKRRKRRY